MASSSTQTAAGSEAAIKGVALVKAVEAGNINEVTRLLGKKAHINYVHRFMVNGAEYAQTPLMAAVLRGHAEVAKFLITRKANVNLAEPCHGPTALHYAASSGNNYMIELLMSKGAKHDVRDKKGLTPRHMATAFGCKEAVACLLDHAADINAVDKDGETALHTAAHKGIIPMIQLLISKGAKLDVRNKDGWMPLQLAAVNGQKEAVICLLDLGADINAANIKGVTALHSAASEGRLEDVKLLVLKGADMKREWKGLTALDFAAFHGKEKIVDFLIKSGARFNETGTVAKDCKFCGKVDPANMMRCIGCKSIHYCCAECQESDWQNHKSQCLSIKAMREKYMDEGIQKKIVEKYKRFQIEEGAARTSTRT